MSDTEEDEIQEARAWAKDIFARMYNSGVYARVVFMFASGTESSGLRDLEACVMDLARKL